MINNDCIIKVVPGFSDNDDFFSLLEEVYEDPIVKAEREFFEIIKQEQEARLEQRQKKQDPSAQDLEWKVLVNWYKYISKQ